MESLERHGHLDLDPRVRRSWVAVAVGTRLGCAVLGASWTETSGGGQSTRTRRAAEYSGTVFADWNAPPPGFLEIDLVVHHVVLLGGVP